MKFSERIFLVLIFFFLYHSIILVSGHGGQNELLLNKNPNIIIIMLISLLAGVPTTIFGYFLLFFFYDVEKSLVNQIINPLLGISVGILLFLSFDYLNLSGFLGLQTTNKLLQFSLVLVFVTTLIITFVLDNNQKISPILIWSIILGVHSFAEGLIIGFNLRLGLIVLVEFFSILSFILHKIAEGFTASTFLKVNNINSEKYIFFLSLISGLPIIFGAILGYFWSHNVFYSRLSFNLISHLYAISFGGVVYILPKFFSSFQNKSQGKEDPKIGLWIGLGILVMFGATIFHEI